MSGKHLAKRALGTAPLVLLLAVGCGGPEAGDDPGESTVETSNPIVAGTQSASNSRAVVAVYHKDSDSPGSDWFREPCTGRVLNPSAPEKLIVTARHCVNAIGSPDVLGGPALSPGQFRISGELQPGQAPLANAVTPCAVVAPPYPGNGFLDIAAVPSNPSGTLDMALIWVCGAIPGLPTSFATTPLYLGSTGDFETSPLTNLVFYGYGCNNPWGSSVAADPSTSGRLRAGSGASSVGQCSVDHVCTGFSDGGATGYDWLRYDFSNGIGGTRMCPGDSGGPSVVQLGSVWVQTGVHNATGGGHNWDVAVSRITNQFIQSELHRFYLRPRNSLTRSLTRHGSTLSADAVQAGNDAQWWEYHYPKRWIRGSTLVSGSTCLARSSGTALSMATCSNATTQRWWMSKTAEILTGDGNCIELQSDFTVLKRPCSGAASQQWYWDPDSGLPGVF